MGSENFGREFCGTGTKVTPFPLTSPAQLGQPATPNDLRRGNRSRVLRLVRRHGPISRAEIAERSGLSRAALTGIAQDLLDEGVLIEGARVPPVFSTGAAGPARRAGVGLSFNPSFALAVGIELTDGWLRGVLLDLAGDVLAQGERTFERSAAPETVVQQAAGLIDALRETVPEVMLGARRLRGIGLAASGQVDPVRGLSVSVPGLARWRDVPLRAEIERLTGLPVELDWRVRAATLAEQWYGGAREADDFVYVNVSDGVGMGLVLGDQIQRGWRSLAGGMGHIQVGAPEAETRMCVCGNKGCLQTLVSVPAIVRRVERALVDGVQSVLLRTVNGEGLGPVTFERVLAAAAAGDKLALGALEDAGEYLGRGIAAVVNLLNPPLVVVGGEIARAESVVLPNAVRAARRWSRQRAFDGLQVVASRLHPGAAMGAATMMLQLALGESAVLAGVAV
jgi:N-acetylglucosamine repressor